MADDQPVAALVAEPDQQHPEQRRPGQVEAAGALGRPVNSRSRASCSAAGSPDRSTSSSGISGVAHDELHRLAQPFAGEPGAQAGVAGQQRRARRRAAGRRRARSAKSKDSWTV